MKEGGVSLEDSHCPLSTFTQSGVFGKFFFPFKNKIKALYGASNDRYSNPRCCWHPSGLYVYSSSQDNSIVVWELASGRVVERLTGMHA